MDNVPGAFGKPLGDAQRQCVEGVMRRADRNAHGHIAQALRLKFMDDLATFIATIGGASVMAASAVLFGSEAPQRTVEFGLAIVGGIITLVGVWQAVWRPGERSRSHKSWAMRFSRIEDDCRLVLAGEPGKSISSLLAEQIAAQQDADLVADRYWRRGFADCTE